MAILLVAALLMAMALFAQKARAATGSVYLTPATASVQNGNTFTTNVRVNPGTAVDTVDVTLTFDTTKLTYQTITYAGSPFGAQFGYSASGNTVHFTSTILGGNTSSDSFLATMTFQAAAGSGTTSLSLTGSNAALNGTSTNPAAVGATITLTSPVSNCPAGQTGTPPNCVTPTPTPTPTSTGGSKTSSGGPTSPVPTAPTPVTAGNADISTSLDHLDIQFTLANLALKSKSPTQVYIRYGLDPNNMPVQTSLSELGTSHNVTLDSTLLLPGQTYYYQIFSKNSHGQSVQTQVTSFMTKGLTAKVGFFDKHHKPLANKQVTIHSTPQTVTTDHQGFATFNNLTPGSHTVSYVAGGKTYSQSLQLQNNIQTVGSIQTAEPQSFSMVMNFSQTNGLLSPLGMGLVGVVVITVVGLALRRRRSGDGFGDYIPTLNPVTVGGDAGKHTYNSVPNEELTKQLESTPMPHTSAPGTVISSGKNVDTDGKN